MNSLSWTSELELVDVLERRLTEKAAARPGKQVRVFREFDAGLGRVDLLCVWYDQDRLAVRRAACAATGLKPFKLLDGYAMSFLRGSRWVEQHRLQEALRVSARRTDNLVEMLSQRGLIERRDSMVRARPLSRWLVNHSSRRPRISRYSGEGVAGTGDVTTVASDISVIEDSWATGFDLVWH